MKIACSASITLGLGERDTRDHVSQQNQRHQRRSPLWHNENELRGYEFDTMRMSYGDLNLAMENK